MIMKWKVKNLIYDVIIFNVGLTITKNMLAKMEDDFILIILKQINYCGSHN